MVSRSYIPRGCRTNHIPVLSEESTSLYEEYKKQYVSDPFDNGTIETGNTLMNNMKEEEEMGEGYIINQHDSQPSKRVEDYQKSCQ